MTATLSIAIRSKNESPKPEAFLVSRKGCATCGITALKVSCLCKKMNYCSDVCKQIHESIHRCFFNPKTQSYDIPKSSSQGDKKEKTFRSIAANDNSFSFLGLSRQ